MPGGRRARRIPRATTRWPSGSPGELGAFRPNQYANPHNPRAHELTTGPGAVAPDRRAHHPLRRRRRHVRHDHRRRPLPQGAEPGDQDHRRRPGGLGVLRRLGPARTSSRASARTSSPPPGNPSCYDEVIADQRRGELPHGPPREPRRGHPHRRLRRHGRGRRDPGRQGGRARRHRRRAQPRLRPRLPVAGVRRRVDGQLRLPRASATSASARCSTPAAPRSTSCSTSTPTRPCARRSI